MFYQVNQIHTEYRVMGLLGLYISKAEIGTIL